MIKHSLKLFLYSLVLFSSNVFAQPTNDLCQNAVQLCPNETISGSTVDATVTSSSDNAFCFSTAATIWFYFITDADGGNVTIDLTGLSFDPDPTFGQQIDAVIFEVGTPCTVATYVPNSACGSGSTDFSITSSVVLTANTTYYVQVNGRLVGAGVTEPAACDFDIEISGDAIDKTPPIVTIFETATTICLGDNNPVNYVVTDCADTTNFEWLLNGASIYSGSANNFNTSYIFESGDLELIVSCDEDCPQVDTSNILTYTIKLIEAEAGPDKFITEGDQVTLEGSGSGDPIWSPSSSLLGADVFQPIATPEQTTTYYLTVTSDGCTLTDTMTVYIGELVTIYTAFTPNGDNINDTWVISNSVSYPNMEVSVYDRSGQEVFNTTNYSTPEKWWDGTFKGKELPSSAYYYVVKLNDPNDNIYKGQVTIVR